MFWIKTKHEFDTCLFKTDCFASFCSVQCTPKFICLRFYSLFVDVLIQKSISVVVSDPHTKTNKSSACQVFILSVMNKMTRLYINFAIDVVVISWWHSKWMRKVQMYVLEVLNLYKRMNKQMKRTMDVYYFIILILSYYLFVIFKFTLNRTAVTMDFILNYLNLYKFEFRWNEQ